MSELNKDQLLQSLVELLDLPESAYEKTKYRYEDLGEWLSREDSSCAKFKPHIFPQGSFRIGTAIKPLGEAEEYDLDLACCLSEGVTTSTHSQKELKKLIESEMQTYRTYRNIKEAIESKRRCLRLLYADKMSFYMDVVPCIPGTQTEQMQLLENFQKSGMDRNLASAVSKLAVKITDDKHKNFNIKCDNWLISNPEGYAIWFESKMLSYDSMLFAKSEIEKIPMYKRKTTLQKLVQLLKRHRDILFRKNLDSKPISIIITTIAGEKYSGSTNLYDSLRKVILSLEEFIRQERPILSNPVNQNEKFTDKWYEPEYKNLKLKESFENWVASLKIDFENLFKFESTNSFQEIAERKFDVRFSNDNHFKNINIITSKSDQHVKDITNVPSKPWSRIY